MQFLNPCWHMLPKNPKHSRSDSKKLYKDSFSKKNHFPSQWSSLIVEQIFENNAEKKSPESKKVFTRSQKKFTNSVFRKVSICYESDHLDTYNAALTTLPQILLL